MKENTMSENTIRVVQGVSRSIDFKSADFEGDVIEAFKKTAAERGKTVDLSTFRYVGEVEPPRPAGFENHEYPDNIAFYAFEAEAV